MLAAETNKQILIVDRDVAAVEPLRRKLSEAGFAVRGMTDAAAAATLVAERPPHLIMIEWDMPGAAALEIINQIRVAGMARRVRVMVLVTGDERDTIAAFDFGADDVITKPVSTCEVVARAGALLRCRSRETTRSTLSCGFLELDTGAARVTVRGKLINLRGTKYRLLKFLMAHSGCTFNRHQLLAQVWGDAALKERTVDVNVQRLRQLLREAGCEAHVQTIRETGYRFDASVLVGP